MHVVISLNFFESSCASCSRSVSLFLLLLLVLLLLRRRRGGAGPRSVLENTFRLARVHGQLQNCNPALPPKYIFSTATLLVANLRFLSTFSSFLCASIVKLLPCYMPFKMLDFWVVVMSSTRSMPRCLQHFLHISQTWLVATTCFLGLFCSIRAILVCCVPSTILTRLSCHP